LKTKQSLEPEAKRSESVKFRATPSQKKHIAELAQQTGMTVSDYVLARAFNYSPKARATALEESMCNELTLARTDYKKYYGMLTGMNEDLRRQMFNNERWMVSALRLLDVQRNRIDYILNVVFGKNHLPPRVSTNYKTTTEQ
jgi:uncharacterized protein (DUF1778 family)